MAAQSGAMVQQLPPAAAVERLNSNLAKLARSPQDVEALLGAGQAALDLGDVQAANGFFTRANSVNPNLGRAKLGLAQVQLGLKQPSEAAANFDAAEALGESIGDRLADRALAYDLTGQQAKAQRDYQAALRANPKDAKAMMRYAVSLGIGGRVAEADKLLEPSLEGGDREAWRFRAFIYAMNGRLGEARNITQSVMPKGLADALDPYMARVSLLTPAQKAAAAHYGDFPANVLRLAVPNERPVQQQAPVQLAVREAQPEPAKADTKRSNNRRDRSDSKATPPPAQTLAQATPPPAIRAQPEPARPALKPPPPPAEDEIEAPRAEPVRIQPARPVVQQALTAPATRNPTLPPPLTPKATPSPAQSSLAAALSQLTVPEAEKAKATPAVDLQALAKTKADKAKAEREAKAKAEKEAKAKAEAEEKKRIKANPSRIWVQIAAGRNVNALAFDMRRFRKSYADEMGDETGWYADWGQTNRLLIGPYRKEEKAKEVAQAIKKAGGDAFVWLSDAGEEVKKIGAE
ncbi:MAG: tetratricopeptide repeat protein [Sphingobium sp.]|nr:tetratricopeptide repeat protein [Sphingobium sp.]